MDSADSRLEHSKIGKGERRRDMGELDDEVLEWCIGTIEARGFTAVCNH